MIGIVAMVGVGLATVLSGVYYNYPSPVSQMDLIKQSFKQKVDLSHPPCFVNDTTMVKHVKEKLTSQSSDGVYYLVEGPHGCGKTTALRSAAAAIGENIVYVAVEENKDFDISLANALSIDLGCKESPSASNPKKKCPETLEKRVASCLNELEEALKEIKKERKPVPILIIDNVNHLLDKDAPQNDAPRNVFFKLQSFAKRMADERLLTIYFASSEGKVYHVFHQKSAVSRLVLFPQRKWEVFKDEALEYLHCQCSYASKQTITEIYDIVGGHFAHLVRACVILNNRKTSINLRVVKNELFEEVYYDLELLGISKTPPTSKTGHALTDVTWSLAKKLLVSWNNIISFEEDDLWQNLSDEKKNELARIYIFDIDWIEHQITFQTTLVHSYFKDTVERKNQK